LKKIEPTAVVAVQDFELHITPIEDELEPCQKLYMSNGMFIFPDEDTLADDESYTVLVLK
jgi:hypothetical protein